MATLKPFPEIVSFHVVNLPKPKFLVVPRDGSVFGGIDKLIVCQVNRLEDDLRISPFAVYPMDESGFVFSHIDISDTEDGELVDEIEIDSPLYKQMIYVMDNDRDTLFKRCERIGLPIVAQPSKALY